MPFFRFMFGLPMAALITVGLFMAMSGMIAQKEITAQPTEGPVIDILAKIVETDPKPRPPRTTVPEAPETPPIVLPRKSTLPTNPLPSELFEPGPIGPGEIDGLTMGRPTIKTAPAYPEGCRSRGAEGTVIVEFDVSADGSVVNARIISSPDRCFNRTAIKSVSSWKYTPAVRDGRAIPQRGLREVFSFQLQD